MSKPDIKIPLDLDVSKASDGELSFVIKSIKKRDEIYGQLRRSCKIERKRRQTAHRIAKRAEKNPFFKLSTRELEQMVSAPNIKTLEAATLKRILQVLYGRYTKMNLSRLNKYLKSLKLKNCPHTNQELDSKTTDPLTKEFLDFMQDQ